MWLINLKIVSQGIQILFFDFSSIIICNLLLFFFEKYVVSYDTVHDSG